MPARSRSRAPLRNADESIEREPENAIVLPHVEFNANTNPAESPTAVDHPKASAKTNKPKSRRKRTGWNSSTGLQRRKRAEILFLREHVLDLEAHAEQLKSRVGLIRAKGGPSDWQKLAEAKYAERKKAEEMNQTLRGILRNQLQLSDTLQANWSCIPERHSNPNLPPKKLKQHHYFSALSCVLHQRDVTRRVREYDHEGYLQLRQILNSSDAMMSATLLEPDDMATVAEALAFIDACEGSESPVSNRATSGSESGASPLPDTENFVSIALDSVEKSVETKKQPPIRKRKSKNPAGYSTKLLHRKKAEMQQLREEAMRLEAKVEHLKRTRTVGVGALAAHATQLTKKAEMKWMEVAILELQRRQRSEYTNRKLKTLMANQAKVDEALRAVVMKRSVMEGMNVLFENSPSLQNPLAAVDNSSVIMAELEKKVSEMYLGSKSLFHANSDTPIISCEMRRRNDDQLGETVEIVSSAPLSCSMEAASSSLWKELTTIRTYPDKSYRYMQTSTPNVMQKNFDQILRGNSGATPINGLQFMRKFEEEDRVVLARAYRMLLPTDGLHLRANAWTIFSRSKAKPADASEVRAFVQLYMEVRPDFSARPEDIAYLRDVAFETWSAKMRGHAQYLQEVLIEVASEAPSGASQLLLKSVC
ncbi:unnamed protein product [Phytophthora lilii]|uniref:Unnamed protein product n=1 Tax=Phytophthora lilii TaxID=2077276 RepID=A0A9W6TP58_9STRA|nr:unnamed protein product [Phytophthora lilii]